MTSLVDLNSKKDIPRSQCFIFRCEATGHQWNPVYIKIKSPNWWQDKSITSLLRKWLHQKLQSLLPMLGPTAHQHGPKGEQPLGGCGGLVASLCISPNVFSPWLPDALPHDWEPAIQAAKKKSNNWQDCTVCKKLICTYHWFDEKNQLTVWQRMQTPSIQWFEARSRM